MIKPDATTEVNEGTNVNLKCEASGKPLPDIEWRVKGSDVILASGQGSKDLVFSAINRRNQSEYQCIALNVAGKITENAKIIVNCKYYNQTVCIYVQTNNPESMREL